ncbi:MAG: hypothetical protein JW999_01385 [Methanotrichaceae archaeon]|nr:hypothetical protein [Methanotrichaceae archaeon]
MRQKRVGVEMKSFIAMASMVLFVFAAQCFGFAFGTEDATANESINVTSINETLKNATLTNETLGNETLSNETLDNATLINGTLENESLDQNDSDPFANTKNRQPTRR